MTLKMLDIPLASLFLSIAALSVTGYIAWQQWQTAKNRLRFDLFEKRFAVFEATMKLIAIAVAKGDISEDERREFAVATKGAGFLFDQKVQQYCDRLAREAINVHVSHRVMENPTTGTRREQSVDSWSEKIQWFSEQLDEVPKRFAPFLKVRG